MNIFRTFNRMIRPNRNNRDDNQLREDQAFEEIQQKNLLSQHMYLVGCGFESPLENLMALRKVNGDQAQALSILQEHKIKHDFKSKKREEKIQRNEERAQNRNGRNCLRMQGKEEKYQKKLIEVNQQIQMRGWNDQMTFIVSRGFTNRVKIFKILSKCKGDQQQALLIIQKKSIGNPEKYMEKQYNQPSQIQSQIQVNQNSNYPQQLNFPQQQNYPMQQNFSQQQTFPQQQNFPQQLNFPQQTKQFPFSEIDYLSRPEQQHQAFKSDHFSQLQKEIDQSQKNSQNAQIPEGVDQDAYLQMLASECNQVEEEQKIQQQKPQSQIKENENEISDQDVEEYIKKNQFLIANGFQNAKQNMKSLVRFNGDEQKALADLTTQQLSKLQVSNVRQKKRNKNKDNSSDSKSSSDSDD